MAKIWTFPILFLSFLTAVVSLWADTTDPFDLQNKFSRIDCKGGFTCKHTKECIPRAWICDGGFDCGGYISNSSEPGESQVDTSDEENCDHAENECPPNYFRCQNMITCVPYENVCDQVHHCPDSSDEGEFCNSTICDNLKCDYGCKPTHSSGECYCPAGQEYFVVEKQCISHRQCFYEEQCDQNCVNTKDSYKCTCNDGYDLKNTTNCQAINDPPDFPTFYALSFNSEIKFFLENGTLYSSYTYNCTTGDESCESPDFQLTFDVNHSNKTLCFAQGPINHMGYRWILKDIERKNSTIFWNGIQCSTFDGSSAWTYRIRLSSHFSSFINKLSFDWISNNWYFLDVIQKSIIACNSTFSSCAIVAENVHRSFAIDANEGYLFYVYYDDQYSATLYRSRLDGSSKTRLFAVSLVNTNIALDLTNQHLYFNQIYSKPGWSSTHINRVNYDGTIPKTVLDIQGNKSSIYIRRLSIFERRLLILSIKISENSSLVYNHDLFNRRMIKKWLDFNITASDFRVVHHQSQLNLKYSEIHPCSINNNGCEHLCLTLYDENRKPVGKCRCSTGFQLANDQKSCESHNDIPNIFVYVKSNKVGMIPFDNVERLSKNDSLFEQKLVLPALSPYSHTQAANYDPEKNTVYFSDIHKHSILKYTIPREAETDNRIYPITSFITTGVIRAHDLAIDHVGRNLYFIDSAHFGINVISLKNSQIRKRMIIDNLGEFQTRLALDSKRGYMFWCSEMRIEKAQMDGLKRTILIEEDISSPSALAIDSDQDRMFWFDRKLQRLEYSNLNGQNRVTIIEKFSGQIFRMNWFKGYLFLSGQDRELWGPGYFIRMMNITSDAPLDNSKTVFQSLDYFEDFKFSTTNTDYRSLEVKYVCDRCEHLCLQNPSGVVCACADGFEILSIDSTKCSKILNYTKPIGCQPGFFECEITPQCIEENQVCDPHKTWDCVDGTDESPERCKGKNLYEAPTDDEYYLREMLKIMANISEPKEEDQFCPGQYRCDSGKCVADKTKCDDMECEYPRKRCISNNSTVCLEISQFCNGLKECDDGSDENELICDLGLCEISDCDNCQNLPFEPGFICYCPEHHVLSSDNKTCENLRIHPCDSWDRCSHFCSPFENRKWNCSCEVGYRLESDMKSCKSLDSTLPIVLYTSHTGIYQISGLSAKNAFPISRGLKKPISVDFLYQKTSAPKIFWTDVEENKIYEADLLNGVLENKKTIIENGLKYSEGLAVDWIGKNIYWVTHSGQIEVATLSGMYRRRLISEDMLSPRGIALDPNEKLMFWADWTTDSPRIEAASMDGTNRKMIVKMTPGLWPNGITLDYIKKRVFWIDAKNDHLSTCKYDGSDLIQELFKNEYLAHPFAISLFEDRVIWTDWRSNTIAQADKFSGKNLTVLAKSFQRPLDIKVLHSTRQPVTLLASPCDTANCSHICLLSTNERGFTCACPHSMKLVNSTCTYKESFIVLARADQISVVDSENIEEQIFPPLEPPLVFQPIKLQVDSANKVFYWIDQNAIKRYFYENGIIETVFPDLLFVPTAFTYDSKNIYIVAKNAETEATPNLLETVSDDDEEEDQEFSFLDEFTIETGFHNFTEVSSKKKHPSIIFVQSFKGEFLSQIKPQVEFLDVVSITVDEETGYLYWSDNSDFKIRKCKLDGSQVQTLTSSDFSPPDELYIDKSDTQSKLYWLSGMKIQYMDLKTLTIKKIYPLDELLEDSWPSSFSIFKSKMYILFIDENIRTINKIDGSELNTLSNQTEATSISIYNSKSNSVENQCKTNNGNCDHLCVPFGNGQVQCLCAIGFELNSTDSVSCQAPEELILYSSNWGINSLILKSFSSINSSLEEQSKVKVEEKLNSPSISRPIRGSSLEFDNSGTLYMADSDEGSIAKVQLDNSKFKVLLSGIQSLGDFLYDWMSQNFYFIDEKFPTIEVFKLDPDSNVKSRMVLVYEQIFKPESLAIHPSEGLLFWSDVGHQNAIRIERSFLDGSNRTVIFEIGKSKHLIQHLSLDLQKPFLYFSDIVAQKILRINYRNPGDSAQVILEKIRHPVAINVHRDYLYWADTASYGGGVYRLNHTKLTSLNNSSGLMFEGSMTGVELIRSETAVYDLQIYTHREVDPANSCSRNNGGCEDFCFFRGQKLGHRCACSYGYLSPNDSSSCLESDHFLLFRTKTSQLKAIHLEEKEIGRAKPLEVAETSSFISALSYDYDSRTIFYADLLKNTISKCNFNGSSHEVVLYNQSQIGAMAYDQSGKELFWSSLANATISKMSFVQLKPLIILQLNASSNSSRDHDRIVDLAVDHCHSRIYLANCNWKSPAIQRFDYSGKNLETLIRGPESRIKAPSALALDAQFLFWADLFLAKIERCDLDAAHCLVLHTEMIQSPINLAVFQNQLFWSDQVAIMRANKFTGEDVKLIERFHTVYTRFEFEPPMVVVTKDHNQCQQNLNPCESYNGGCEDICTVVNTTTIMNTAICSCNPGRQLGADKRSCHKTSVCPANDSNCMNKSNESADNSPLCEMLNCAHSCKDTPLGYQCFCREGFEAVDGGKICRDIDECQQRSCSHYCNNSYGSFHCYCQDGYILDLDNRTCLSLHHSEAKLLFTAKLSVHQLGSLRKSPREMFIISSYFNPVAVDFDWEEDCIYWSEMTDIFAYIKRVCKLPKEGNSSTLSSYLEKNIETLHSENIKSPVGIAVDWIGRNLYWTDKTLDTIEVSRLDGKFPKVLIHENLEEPRAIVLNPLEGLLFWTDWGKKPHIGRASMNGNDTKIILDTDLGWPNGLTIDYARRELYYADARLEYIGVMNFEGKNRAVLFHGKGSNSMFATHVFGLSFFESRLYWTDWHSRVVVSCSTWNCTADNFRVHAYTNDRPMDVQVVHPDRQPALKSKSPCSKDSCFGLCLLKPWPDAPENETVTSACACPGVLAEDGYSCRHNCLSYQFSCSKSFKCIPAWHWCDGEKDCLHGEDEEDCECPGPSPRCANNNTVDFCEDGSLCNATGSSPNKNNIVHYCPWSMCSQLCTSHLGNFTCHCAEGFSKFPAHDKEEQEFTCEARGSQVALLAASDKGLKVVNAQKTVQELYNVFSDTFNSSFHLPLNKSHSVSKIESVDVYYSANSKSQIFWTNPLEQTLYSVPVENIDRLLNFQYHQESIRNLNSTTGETFHVGELFPLVQNIENPRGLAVDWLSEHVYFISAKSLNFSIKVTTFDGSKVKTILQGSPLDEPWDLVVDPKNCFIFWSDWGHSGIKIGRSSLDGSQQRAIVKTDLESALGLALDHEANRLYWTDPKSFQIETVRIDGTDRRKLYNLRKLSHQPIRIELFEDWLYVTTRPSNHILKLDKFGRTDKRIVSLVQNLHKLTDVVALQLHKQSKFVRNACSTLQNGTKPCPDSFICLAISSINFSCKCPDGFESVKDDCVPIASHVEGLDSDKDDKCSCLNGGHCRYREDESKYCQCSPFYEGELCERFRCEDRCHNRATCYIDLSNASSIFPPSYQNSSVGTPRCLCATGFRGDKCDEKISKCSNNTCLNGGHCSSSLTGDIKCGCLNPFHGEECESCHIPCGNGGVCRKSENDHFYCECPSGFAGESCQQHVCSSAFCFGNGNCFVQDYSRSDMLESRFRCQCKSGFFGERCDHGESDNCDDIHCQNGGICHLNSDKKAICICSKEYSGILCEVPEKQSSKEIIPEDSSTFHVISWTLFTIVCILFGILIIYRYKLISCSKVQSGLAFQHRRIESNNNVEIVNPAFSPSTLEEEAETGFSIIDFSTTNFSNPIYEYKKQRGEEPEERANLLETSESQ